MRLIGLGVYLREGELLAFHGNGRHAHNMTAMSPAQRLEQAFQGHIKLDHWGIPAMQHKTLISWN